MILITREIMSPATHYPLMTSPLVHGNCLHPGTGPRGLGDSGSFLSPLLSLPLFSTPLAPRPPPPPRPHRPAFLLCLEHVKQLLPEDFSSAQSSAWAPSAAPSGDLPRRADVRRHGSHRLAPPVPLPSFISFNSTRSLVCDAVYLFVLFIAYLDPVEYKCHKDGTVSFRLLGSRVPALLHNVCHIMDTWQIFVEDMNE